MTPGALAALHRDCFTTPRPWTAAEFSDLLADPHVWLEGVPQGFALGRAVAGEAELLTLAVAPTARRQGLGRGLLSAFEAGAAARGAMDVFLEVSSANHAARSLYATQGYLEAGLRRRYYRDPDGAEIDGIVMRKLLKRAYL